MSQTLAQRRRMLIGAIAIGTLALSGCVSEVEAQPQPSPPPSSPTTEPTGQPQVTEPVDVLFTVTAKVRTTDGETVEVSLVAHQPRAWNDPEISDLAEQFLVRCAAGTGVTPIDADYLTAQGATLMHIEFTSSSPDHQFESPLAMHFGNVYFPRAAFTDAVVTGGGETDCFAGATWVFSNDAYAIAAFEAGNPTPDRKQWQYGSYGFQLLPDVNTSISSCVKVITELGKNSGVEMVDGWDTSRDDGNSACGIGYIGE